MCVYVCMYTYRSGSPLIGFTETSGTGLGLGLILVCTRLDAAGS